MHELDEFYPYVEMTQIAQNPDRFKGSFDGGRSPALVSFCSKEKNYRDAG